MYKLADMSGNGILADLARLACKSGKNDQLDAAIQEVKIMIERKNKIIHSESETISLQQWRWRYDHIRQG